MKRKRKRRIRGRAPTNDQEIPFRGAAKGLRFADRIASKAQRTVEDLERKMAAKAGVDRGPRAEPDEDDDGEARVRRRPPPPPPPPPKAIGYDRKSWEDEDPDFGIHDWSDDNDLEGLDEFGNSTMFHDNGSAGDRIGPGLLAAFHAIEDGEASVLVIRRLDRLARDRWLQEQHLNRIWRAGGRVFTLYPRGYVEDTREGRLMRRRWARAAEEELDAIRARRERGSQALRERQGYTGGNRYQRPYGRELVLINGRRRYRPVPDEQEWIRWMTERHREGWSYRRIARELNALEVATVTGAKWSDVLVGKLVRLGPMRPALIRPHAEFAFAAAAAGSEARSARSGA